MREVAEFLIGVYGEVTGLYIIALVSIWDFVVLGLRGFFEYRIGWIGIVAIWIGIALIVASKRLDKTFGRPKGEYGY